MSHKTEDVLDAFYFRDHPSQTKSCSRQNVWLRLNSSEPGGISSASITTSTSFTMALGSTGRQLHVPSADMLAKNMRAIEAARGAASAPHNPSNSDSVSPTFLMGIGAAVEDGNKENRRSIRFRKAEPDNTPNFLVTFANRIFASKKKRTSDSPQTEKSGAQKAFEKSIPHLERAAELLSRLPDPTLLYLAVVLVVLLIDRLRPHWFNSILIRIAAIASFVPLMALALLWRKTELFAQLREGHNPLRHPAEHRLDGQEASVKEREERVRQAEETLQKERAQVDALRKELGKDPNALESDGVIIPSKKAAEMIAAGALGATFDDEAAQLLEEKRKKWKEDNVKKSRDEWKQRTEETENHAEQTNESVKLLEDHAATAYTKRTRELKTRTSSGTPRATDRLPHLKKVVQLVRKEDDIGRRISRYSERSTASMANSTSSRRRVFPFRRRRRTTEQTNPPEEVMERSGTVTGLNTGTVDV